jgi:hypothetical protein
MSTDDQTRLLSDEDAAADARRRILDAVVLRGRREDAEAGVWVDEAEPGDDESDQP